MELEEELKEIEKKKRELDKKRRDSFELKLSKFLEEQGFQLGTRAFIEVGNNGQLFAGATIIATYVGHTEEINKEEG